METQRSNTDRVLYLSRHSCSNLTGIFLWGDIFNSIFFLFVCFLDIFEFEWDLCCQGCLKRPGLERDIRHFRFCCVTANSSGANVKPIRNKSLTSQHFNPRPVVFLTKYALMSSLQRRPHKCSVWIKYSKTRATFSRLLIWYQSVGLMIWWINGC